MLDVEASLAKILRRLDELEVKLNRIEERIERI